ncbi:hypothetical protein LBMAG34_0100 [Candidatus Saccharibacteria bacterium]|nr:hypothetical protein LBMAG34_0100 [Candidatus Saccharibacteria bacterium]
MTDLISVIMPVYNSEKYLAESIESILKQSYKNFELIIINDGSSDESLNIINKYNKKDKRIVVINQNNRGIVESLNTAIEKSRGKFIARMDSDDICVIDRFKEQVSFLENNNKVGLVAGWVKLIDEDGKDLAHEWAEDRKAQTEEEIKAMMTKTNCVAHPTVMVRTELMKKYKYREQKGGEDYDLWLRMLSDGVIISKVKKNLLKYRIHDKSITGMSNAKSSLKKIINLKNNFLKYQISRRKWGEIEKNVLKSLRSDYINYYADHSSSKIIKYPSKALRKSARAYNKSKKIKPYFAEKKILKEMIPNNLAENDKKNVLFILPWMTTGGADKVALDIASGLKNEYNWHFITTEPENDNSWSDYFLKVSKNICHISDFIKFQRNKTYFINNYCKLNNIDRVIISNSISGYISLPTVKKNIKEIKVLDILHGEGGRNDNGGAPKFMQPYEVFIDKHIVVSEYLKKYLVNTYKNKNKKITVIHNGVDTNFFKPSSKEAKNKISWIGRFSEEKNPLLFAKLAQKNKKFDFVMAGDGPMYELVEQYIKDNQIHNLNLLGKIKNSKSLIEESRAIVMTSRMEGLPIVILEAGSMGKPVFVPNVGGIPEYVVKGGNGIMHNNEDELFSNISKYLNKKNTYWEAEKIRENVIKKYSLEKMLDEYKKII